MRKQKCKVARVKERKREDAAAKREDAKVKVHMCEGDGAILRSIFRLFNVVLFHVSPKITKGRPADQ